MSIDESGRDSRRSVISDTFQACEVDPTIEETHDFEDDGGIDRKDNSDGLGGVPRSLETLPGGCERSVYLEHGHRVVQGVCGDGETDTGTNGDRGGRDDVAEIQEARHGRRRVDIEGGESETRIDDVVLENPTGHEHLSPGDGVRSQGARERSEVGVDLPAELDTVSEAVPDSGSVVHRGADEGLRVGVGLDGSSPGPGDDLMELIGEVGSTRDGSPDDAPDRGEDSGHSNLLCRARGPWIPR